MLLAVAIAVAGASSAVMAHLADRVGARRLLWIALFAWSVLLCVLALTRERVVFVVVLVLVEIAGGSIDTAMNAEASHRLVDHPVDARAPARALQHGRPARGRRRRRSSSTPACRGAGSGRRSPSWRWRSACGPLATDAGAAPVAAATTARRRRDEPPHPMRRLRRDGLLVLLVVFALAEITEGGVDTWGVLFLRNHLATGVLLGAGAYVVGQSVAATTRGAGGPLLGRLSTRTRARSSGGCVAGGGILLESLAPASGVAARRARPRRRRGLACSGRSS